MGVVERSLLAALAVLLAGCSAGATLEQLPTDLGGLPAGAPQRPTAPAVYPAVHDMPPPRPLPTLSDEQQVKLEKDLQTVRDRQEAREGVQAADNGTAAKAKVKKKSAAKPKPADATGTTGNP